MADVLVVGGNGFLGSHLVDRLAAIGHTVTAFDRFSSGRPLYTAEGVRAAPGEFLSRSDLDAAVQGQAYVVHCLSTTTPATAERDPTLDIRTNVAQTIELLDSSVEAGVSGFYFASTGGAIYGPQGKPRYAETDRALPISPYGIGKLAIEHYLSYYRTRFGLPSVSLRISNPYGPRQHPQRRQGLIPIALRQLLSGSPITRFGDGSMVRDYIYVEDVAALVAPLIGRATEHSLYNIGSGVGTSVNAVLEALEHATGLAPIIDERPAPPTFVDQVVLDTTRYREEFGEPLLMSLEAGIAATLAAESRE